jgi:hypothetical protein
VVALWITMIQKKDFLNFRNNLYLLTKNEDLINLLWLIPAKLILDGLAGLKFLLEGNFRSTAAVIKAHMSFYKHLPLVFERRNLEQNLIYRNKINKPDLTGVFFGLLYGNTILKELKNFLT